MATSELQLSDEARFTPVLCPRAAELMASYDEHTVARTFKFGVLQQRRGQTTEEQIFSNRSPSPALLAFLPHLGDTVKLANHKG
jgi:RAP1 GTPase activating protein 1